MKRFPVVAGVIVKEGRILLARRPEGKKRAGLWEFPGGKLEPQEGPEEALKRELREELGVEVSVLKRLAEVDFDYPEVPIRLMGYFCRLEEGEPRPLEGQGLGWFSPEEVEGLRLAPADILLWKEVKKALLQTS